METWEIGDIVGFDMDGVPMAGIIEDADDASYTVRVLAMDSDGLPTVITDEAHTVAQVYSLDKVEPPADAPTEQAPEDEPLPDEAMSEMMDMEVDFELDDDVDIEAMADAPTEQAPEDETDSKATYTVGDFVTWDSAGGQASGRVDAIHEQSYTVPDTDFTIEGTSEDPAYQIEVFDRVDGGWVASGVVVAHHGDALSLTEPLTISDEQKHYPRYIGKIKNAKADETEGIGHIKGYLSVADIVDLGGDVVKKGAFKQTLSHKNGKTVFMLDHGYKTSEVIGVLLLEEDDMGLKMDGCINLATPQGKMAYETAKFQIEQGVPIGASIGYSIVKSAPNAHGGLDLQEVKLYEGSMTPFPMNESATIIEARKRHDRKYRKVRALSLMRDAPKSNRKSVGVKITALDIFKALNNKNK